MPMPLIIRKSKKLGDTYALLYIANSNYRQPPHPLNQSIGMVVSKSLNGPWKKVGKTGLILKSSPDPKHWTYGMQVAYNGNEGDLNLWCALSWEEIEAEEKSLENVQSP